MDPGAAPERSPDAMWREVAKGLCKVSTVAGLMKRFSAVAGGNVVDVVDDVVVDVVLVEPTPHAASNTPAAPSMPSVLISGAPRRPAGQGGRAAGRGAGGVRLAPPPHRGGGAPPPAPRGGRGPPGGSRV